LFDRVSWAKVRFIRNGLEKKLFFVFRKSPNDFLWQLPHSVELSIMTKNESNKNRADRWKRKRKRGQKERKIRERKRKQKTMKEKNNK
jgi:hypothetical protein